MIKEKDLLELLKLAIASGYLKEEQPLSLLILARVESGKTELLKKVKGNQGVLYLTDATPYGIARHYVKDIADGGVRHIIIPDLLVPLSRYKDTVTSFIAFFNALIEEGIVEVRTAFINIEPSKLPAKCGLLTSIIPKALESKKLGWARIGFMSRLLPVSYSYSVPSAVEILSSIATYEYRGKSGIKISLPKEDIEVYCNPQWNRDLIPYSTQLVGTADPAYRLYGFRMQKHLQRLLLASPLLEGRDEVNQADFDKVVDLTRYINLGYTAI